MPTNRQRPPRGKNADPSYKSITAQIPVQLRKDLQDALLFTQGLDVNTLLERLIALWVYDGLGVNIHALDVDALASKAKARQGRLGLDVDALLTALDVDAQTVATSKPLCNQAPLLDACLPVATQAPKPQALLDALDAQDHAQALKMARQYLGMSQRQFGAVLGRSQKMMSFYESGKSTPPQDLLDKARGLLDSYQAPQDGQGRLLELT